MSTAAWSMLRRTPLAAALLALGTAAHAATITVTQNGDAHVSGRCSLREAIAANDAQAVPADTNCTPGSGTDDTIEIPYEAITLTQGALGPQRTVRILGTRASRALIVRDANADVFGVFEAGGDLTLEHVQISGGKLLHEDNFGGGGGINAQAALTLVDAVVSGNSSDLSGGGIYARTTLTLLQRTVSGNESTYAGSGIFVVYGPATITDSTISGNSNANVGGGLFVSSASVALTNSTVANNAATGNGGGICVEGGTLTALNSTIVNNSTQVNGGGLFVDTHASVFLSSTLLSNNHEGKYVEDVDAQGPTTIAGDHDLVDSTSSRVTLPPDTLTCVPNLGTLSDNGGPTQTVPLRPGPCAIDAGVRNSLENDQRGSGHSRVAGPGRRHRCVRVRRRDLHGRLRLRPRPPDAAGRAARMLFGLRSAGRAALGADAVHLERLRARAEAAIARLLGQQFRDAFVADLERARADVADQERHLVRLVRMMTADERVDRFELVDEAVLEQEVERAIDRRRRGGAVLVLEPVEQIVGLDRLRLGRDQLEHAQAQRRQAQAAQLARARHRADERSGVVAVVVACVAWAGDLRHGGGSPAS